jgi:O-antigen/teichoic acid export membrane protein
MPLPASTIPAAVPGMWQITKDSAALAFGTGAGLAARLVLTLVFAHAATPDAYGQYRYIVAVIGFAALTVLPGFTPAIARAAARGHDRTLERGAWARLRVSVLGAAVLFALGLWYARGSAPAVGRAFMMGAVFFPSLAALDVYLPFLSGKGDFRRYALYQGAAVMLPIPFIMLAIVLGAGVEIVALAWMATTAGVNIFLYTATRRRLDPKATVDDAGLRYGTRVSAAYLISAGQLHASNLVTGAFLGPVSLAQLSVGMIAWELFRQAFSLVNLQAMPRMAAGSGADARAWLRRSLLMGTPIVAGVAVAAVWAIPTLVPLLFTAQYQGSVIVAQILTIGAAAAYPGNQANAFLTARAQDRAQFVLSVSTVLVELGTLAALIAPFGIVGVALAKVAMRIWYSSLAILLARAARA